MIPSPRRAVSTPIVPPASWPDIDDDDGWQDMPVVRSDDNPFGLDEEDQRRFHYRAPDRLDHDSSAAGAGASTSTSNATGIHLEVQQDTLITDSWRQKAAQDESDYTRLRLDEDEESEEVAMRTKYLFDEDKAMTPLSQMQATKELLTEGQRIAYVGLCQLIARRMLRDAGRGWEGTKIKGSVASKAKGKGKAEVPVVESANIWMIKIMARLYQHMELERDEQRMIESLAEHGVDPSDLVPALMTTHTVKNPEYDPKAKMAEELGTVDEVDEEEEEAPPPYEGPAPTSVNVEQVEAAPATSIVDEADSTRTAISLPPESKAVNPFGDDEDEETPSLPAPAPKPSTRPPPAPLHLDLDEDDGDIGYSSPAPTPAPASSSQPETFPELHDSPIAVSAPSASAPPKADASEPIRDPEKTPRAAADGQIPLPVDGEQEEEVQKGLPSLPGVSTSLSNTDEMVTLDIRWTVLCDLFLVLIADSVYDARSRAFLERVAEALGFEWLDVVRFENRVTDALEIQEGVEKLDQEDVIEGRRKGARKRRYAMMGLAAVGGGLVIGLSAGLLAPAIGAGLGAAFATVGITGTTGFLAGAGGAAVITTGGVLTGANIASRGMARRTREVRTFELKPLHNNKRVSCYITVGGFMTSKVDDVRLPFSVMDPIVGDVYSVHWEPDMMAEMGSALKILTSEIVTQVGQQVLQATIMYGLLTALQWPIILTKLGYLIDNPWSNALDRSRAAGLVLADTLIHRHAGVRPVSLIGFSLGARTIFYALQELARVKAYGLVQDVVLFGATVTASKSTWLDVRSAVAGRFVNAYATNDWMLGYLFRATSGGLNTVAGLRPVETVPGLENVEVTEIITGHMSYRSCMPLLLAKVGFPVMADYFDEPEDPDTDMSVQERTIVNEAEEEAKRNRKKVLGIFPRKSSSRTGSGANTPTPRVSTDAARRGSTPPEAEGDDELPPREEEEDGDIGLGSHQATAVDAEEEAAVRAISKTAGFDFQAISKELGKNIDVDHLPQPAERPGEGLPLPRPDQRAPIERSGSAPPVTVVTPPNEEIQGIASPAPVRRTSYADPATRQEEEDDQGDITASMGGMSLSDLPSWDRPASGPSAKVSPPAESSSWRSPSFSLNAWSASTPSNSNSSRGTTPPAFSVPRAAPPARPHPPELTANPFAFGGNSGGDGAGGGLGGASTNGSGSGSGSGKGVGGGAFFGGWGKKAEEEEQWATKNPW